MTSEHWYARSISDYGELKSFTLHNLIGPAKDIGIGVLVIGIIEIIITTNTEPICTCLTNNVNCPCGLEQVATLGIILYLGIGKMIVGAVLLAIAYLQKHKVLTT